MLKKKNNFSWIFSAKFILFFIFVFGLVLRFLWFPENVYFGYDQARDAIISQEIFTKGDLKIIGPSASGEGLNHGPLYWYLIGPVYLLFNGNPNGVLAFISIINALGILLVFFFGKSIFSEKAGLIAAFLYAFSFSQLQYSLYFANPAPAVLSIIVYFLGWALLILKDKKWAWILIGFGLGLSIQFEFFLIYLAASLIFFLPLIWRKIREIGFIFPFLGFLSLFFSLSTFFLAELKYGFRITKTLINSIMSMGKSSPFATSTFIGRLSEEMRFEVFGFNFKAGFFLASGLFLILFFCLIKDKEKRKALGLILIWILSNLFVDFFNPPQLYYVNIGVSVAIILFLAYLLENLWRFQKLIFALFIFVLLINNLWHAFRFNPKGPINTLYVQEGMLLVNEKKILDEIYNDAKGKEFSVNALTMPFKIKTTWAYLFNWYGKKKYGYVPYWGGEDVPGYPGIMPVSNSLKSARYSILEPARGIPESLKKEFLDSENGYGKPLIEKKVGNFVWQKR